MINNPQIEEAIVRFLAKCAPENGGTVSLPIPPSNPNDYFYVSALKGFYLKFRSIDFIPKKIGTGFYWDRFIYDNV